MPSDTYKLQMFSAYLGFFAISSRCWEWLHARKNPSKQFTCNYVCCPVYLRIVAAETMYYNTYSFCSQRACMHIKRYNTLLIRIDHFTFLCYVLHASYASVENKFENNCVFFCVCGVWRWTTICVMFALKCGGYD